MYFSIYNGFFGFFFENNASERSPTGPGCPDYPAKSIARGYFAMDYKEIIQKPIFAFIPIKQRKISPWYFQKGFSYG